MSQTILESSFCKNCSNFMDITNNISNIEGDKIKTGGDYEQDILESSDYDVSVSESIGGGINSISETNINNILGGNDVDLSIKNFDVNELNKNSTFNKLTNNQKTLVINRILEKMPKQKTSKNIDSSGKESYFYCKSCGYNEKIPNGQFIFSRGDEKKDEFYSTRFLNYVNDNTLPRSKNYNCINGTCPTHKNPSLKLAVFYRQKGTYNVRYICSVCSSYWNTFVEK